MGGACLSILREGIPPDAPIDTGGTCGWLRSGEGNEIALGTLWIIYILLVYITLKKNERMPQSG